MRFWIGILEAPKIWWGKDKRVRLRNGYRRLSVAEAEV
jgi:hypothetical protein